MLQSTSTNLPLLYDSHGSNLQLLANLGMSSLEQNSSGGVVFRYREEPEQSTMKADTWQAPQTVYSYYASQESLAGGVFDLMKPRIMPHGARGFRLRLDWKHGISS